MHVVFQVMPRNIRIDFEKNGLYLFKKEGAIGKTHLYKQLSKLFAMGESVVAFSYNREKDQLRELQNILSKEEISIILLDRFDLYCNSEFIVYLSMISSQYIILMDYKDSSMKFTFQYEICFIDMTEEELRVYDLHNI